jgi:GMP synthase (glutamine-hydrolysing)
MPTLVFECSDLTGSRRMGSILLDHGHRLDVRRLHRGDAVPADLVDVDAVLCFGGPQSSNDDSLPWMEPLQEFLRNAHAAGVPIFGVCLGSQILARALGGSVQTMAEGPRLGWAPTDLTPDGREDPLHKGQPWQGMQFHWNRDAAHDLPAGARVLSRGDRGDIQSWRLGVRSYGVQHHPEIEPAQVGAWAEDDAQTVREIGLDIEGLHADTVRHYAEFERLTDRFFETIAMLLMPLDRRLHLAGRLP